MQKKVWFNAELALVILSEVLYVCKFLMIYKVETKQYVERKFDRTTFSEMSASVPDFTKVILIYASLSVHLKKSKCMFFINILLIILLSCFELLRWKFDN